MKQSEKNLTPIEKVDHDIEEAWLLRRVDHEESTILAEKCLKESIDLQYTLGIAKSKLVLGMQNSYRNEYEQAEKIFKEVLPIFEKQENTLYHSRTENSIAYTFLNRGEYERALNHLLKALPLAKSIKDNEAVSMILFNIAEIYLDPMLNDHKKALEYYLEAETYGSDKPRAIYALILANIAVCYLALDDQLKALDYANQALDKTNQLTVDSARSQIYNILGNFYYSMKKYQKAYKVIKKGISLHIPDEYPDLQILDYIAMSKTKMALGHSDVEDYLKIALDKAEAFKGSKILGEAYLLYADYLKDNDRYKEASDFYKQALMNKELYYTESLDLHLNALQAEYKHEQIKKDAEIYRLKNIELKEKSQALEKALEELKETQVLLVQNEKMAALGGLISGIAHEINSPFGAIQGSVSNIQHVLDETLTQYLPQVLTKLDEHNKEAFFEILHSAISKDMLLTTREERQLQRTLEKKLLDYVHEDEVDLLASSLVDMGIHDVDPSLVLLIKHPLWKMIHKTCYQLTSILRNVDNISLSIEKASKVIRALKYYTHFNPKEVFEKADLNMSIENILQLFYNQFKGHVNVNLDLNDIEPVYCNLDTLNQVWMNLIQNALQAMNYKGEINISTHYNDRKTAVMIHFHDNGPGIPKEIQEDIFKPFFTTKSQGEGSGLGLSFVQKTIDKHKGKLQLSSQPGSTEFTIELPINPSL